MTMAQSATGAKLATGMAVKSHSQPLRTDSGKALPSLVVNMPAELRCTVNQDWCLRHKALIRRRFIFYFVVA